MSDDTAYPRDLIGYGPEPPSAQWPSGARIALQFVVNYEEGGENSMKNAVLAAFFVIPQTAMR